MGACAFEFVVEESCTYLHSLLKNGNQDKRRATEAIQLNQLCPLNYPFVQFPI
jgi:hypothetical protein